MLNETTLTRYEEELLEEQLMEDLTEEELYFSMAPCPIIPFDPTPYAA